LVTVTTTFGLHLLIQTNLYSNYVINVIKHSRVCQKL